MKTSLYGPTTGELSSGYSSQAVEQVERKKSTYIDMSGACILFIYYERCAYEMHSVHPPHMTVSFFLLLLLLFVFDPPPVHQPTIFNLWLDLLLHAGVVVPAVGSVDSRCRARLPLEERSYFNRLTSSG